VVIKPQSWTLIVGELNGWMGGQFGIETRSKPVGNNSKKVAIETRDGTSGLKGASFQKETSF